MSPIVEVANVNQISSAILALPRETKFCHMTLTTPCQECMAWFIILGLRLAMINLPTKFEVSHSTQYEDNKGDNKIRKLG